MLVLRGGPSGNGARIPAPTWSQRAICRVFQRDTPVVSSRFVLPRKTTLLTRWFLQLASCKVRASSVATPRPSPCPGKAPSIGRFPDPLPLQRLLPHTGKMLAPCWCGGHRYRATGILRLSPGQNGNVHRPEYLVSPVLTNHQIPPDCGSFWNSLLPLSPLMVTIFHKSLTNNRIKAPTSVVGMSLRTPHHLHLHSM